MCPFWPGKYYHNFTLGTLFAFGEAEFDKIKGRKTVSGEHNNLNMTDNNAGPTEKSLVSTELRNVCSNFLTALGEIYV
jgi:hypothetical protein